MTTTTTTTPSVSVVIPTYNQPALLLGTLASVFAQAFTDYEVIVVNDGSTDDTVARLQPYLDRIRLVNQANGGIGVARNRGIDEARGKYVALLDHDDLWRPEKLAVQVAFYERHPACSVVSVPWSYSTDPERCVFPLAAVRNPDGFVDRPLRWMAAGVGFMTSSSMMFDRRRAAGLRYATRRQCIEDQPFHFGLFARGPAGIAGDEIQMVYRWHESNSSSESAYWFNGQRLLREMAGAGAFRDLGDQCADLDAFLSHFGRTAAVRQLCGGYRARALRTYLEELPHQVRDRRLKFLLTLPVLACLPTSLVRRRWTGAAR